MFTKYNGIAIPQNYNGNRFKKQPIETEMKTHKATEVQSTSFSKTSVSPSFQSLLDKAVDNKEDLPEFDAHLETEQDDSPEIHEENNMDEEVMAKEDCDLQENIKLDTSPFIRMLEGLKSDDLLLLALILLFADSKSEIGNEAIILLSLLLLC